MVKKIKIVSINEEVRNLCNVTVKGILHPLAFCRGGNEKILK